MTTFDTLPAAMKIARRWLVWKAVKQHGAKDKKVPYYTNGDIRSGALDSPEDVSNFGSFENATKAMTTGRYTGLGFALGDDGTGNHWAGVDIDHLSEHPELQEHVEALTGMTYCETSPNGDGIHAIGYGETFKSVGSGKDGIEMYAGGRFFTVTGKGLNSYAPSNLKQYVEKTLRPITNKRRAEKPEKINEDTGEITNSDRISDGELITAIIRGDGYHENIMVLTARYVQRGLAETTITPLMQGIMQSVELKDDRWRDRYNDLGRTVRGAVLKYSPAKHIQTFAMPDPMSFDEWIDARPTPECIVEDLFFADVGVLIAAGGTGKTTLILYQGIHVVLGRELFGLRICKGGVVVLITSEDTREMLVARLRFIAQAMNLTPDEIQLVMQNFRIADMSGNGFRLTEVVNDVVKPSSGCEAIIDACQALQPVLIVIDPAVSFGVGESRVNDAEQGLIEAARRLRRALNCCVLYIHHSGKANGREKTIDQYSGRGGSAFADGARMVHVMVSLTPEEWRNETGQELSIGETGLKLARPKMSYCPPVGVLYIKREGYNFELVQKATSNKQSALKDAAEKVWQLLYAELIAGRYHTQNSLELLDTGLKRNALRAAVGWLQGAQHLEHRDMPNASGRGGKRQYLHPTTTPCVTGAGGEVIPENKETIANEKTTDWCAPPIGNSPAAHQRLQDEPLLSYGTPNIDGAPTAHLGAPKGNGNAIYPPITP